MSFIILPLDGLTRNQNAVAGTKATALGELYKAGFRVPNGFVLTTAAYTEFIAPLRSKILARITDDVIMDPSELEGAATEIRGWLEALPFSPALRRELDAALVTLNSGTGVSYAARSSTSSDDLATAFGSGVTRAYLGLVGADEIANAAARSWAGLWNSRSMYYRHRKKIVQTDVAFAVLVQPMVKATSAGVMFTQNPMSGARDEMQIKSIWGLGAPLTSARFRPDEFLVNKTNGKITDRVIEEQVVQLVVGEDGHTEQEGIAAEKIEAPSLTDEQVQELVTLGKRIEDFFGAAQDVEWGIAVNEIVVLQARPIGIRNS